LDAMLARRLTGEPVARIIRAVAFCGLRLGLHPDVYVPRWTSERIALAAVDRLPANGVAIDLCTGCGAVAAAVALNRPTATVLATDLHPPSVACARANGVDAHLGDLFAPLPHRLRGRVDVVVAVPPFVPHDGLTALAAEVLAHERLDALDGGHRGLALVERLAGDARGWLRAGGVLVVEMSPFQIAEASALLANLGFVDMAPVFDLDGDACGLTVSLPPAT
ncbi:MAG: methyltransferase, partial [Acidimicrobiia bacterium]|nr:methyltransferase [Acidimicrobiia bacterium]